MFKGNMRLHTIQRGKLETIEIKQGQVFLLPPKIPHSPQRPETDSLGLVLERRRNLEKKEVECLRWFTDINSCEQVLYEKYFFCQDLAKDLVPVVEEFKSSEACKNNIPGDKDYKSKRPYLDDTTTKVPGPFDLGEFVKLNKDRIKSGEKVNLFQDHPCPEFKIHLVGGSNKFVFPGEETVKDEVETYVYQYLSKSTILTNGENKQLEEGCCLVIGSGINLEIESSYEDSVCIVFRQFPSTK